MLSVFQLHLLYSLSTHARTGGRAKDCIHSGRMRRWRDPGGGGGLGHGGVCSLRTRARTMRVCMGAGGGGGDGRPLNQLTCQHGTLGAGLVAVMDQAGAVCCSRVKARLLARTPSPDKRVLCRMLSKFAVERSAPRRLYVAPRVAHTLQCWCRCGQQHTRGTWRGARWGSWG